MANRKDTKGRVLKAGESQRKDGIYMYRYTDIRGKRQSVYAGDLKELRDKEKSIQKDLDSGIDYTAGNITVIALVKRYLRLKKGVSRQTLERYTATVNRLEQDAFSTRIIRTIKMSDAQQWIISLFEEGKSTGTIKTILAVVKPAFQMACEEDAILKNPFQFKLTNYIPNNRKQRTALTDIQQKNLLAYMESSTVYSKHLDLFIVLLWTGLRVSEYCGLTVDDIDFDLMRIRVERQLIYGKNGVNYIAKPKTAQGTRYIPITQKTYASLQRLVRSSQQNHVISVVDGYSGFIALKRSGKLQARYDIEHVFHDLRRAYNRDNPDKQIHTLSPHVLRHTFCTNMANAGMDVKNSQYIMGHADVSMTLNVYTHATYTHASAQMLKLVNSDGKTSICGA